jgi:hypothetical protein
MCYGCDFGFLRQSADWHMEAQRSKIDVHTRHGQKHHGRLFAPGRWQVATTIDRVNKNGKRTQTHTIWIGKRDGKPYPVTGSQTYDAIAYTEHGFTAMKKGKVIMTGTITYAEDGKSRVVTANGTSAGGKKLESTAKYDKQ